MYLYFFFNHKMYTSKALGLVARRFLAFFVRPSRSLPRLHPRLSGNNLHTSERCNPALA